MEQILFNERLKVTPSEGFEKMSQEELDASYESEAIEAIGLVDKNRKLLVTILYQQYYRLLVLLASLKSMSIKNEQLIKDMYKDHQYEFVKYIDQKVNDIKMSGYVFTYVRDNVKQAVLTLLFKHKDCIYSLNCYKEADDGLNFGVFDDIINSLTFK